MSIEAREHAPQILRVALVAPLVYGLGTELGMSAPFIAAMLYATLALKMPAPPPLRLAVLLGLMLVLLPIVFASLAGFLNEYPYLMIGFTGLVLFHAFRLQSAPKTAMPGVLLQTFAIMMPVIAEAGADLGDSLAAAVSDIFGASAVLALVGIYFGFALFPAPPGAMRAPAAPPAPPPPTAERSRSALVAALVMLPLISLFLVLNAVSAIRMLFTVATVLAALHRRDAYATGGEIVLSVALAGVVAVVFSVLGLIWQAPWATLVAMALVGLIMVPRAFVGRHRAEVTLAVPLVWLLLGAGGDTPILQTVTWSVYSILGVAYAIGAHALLTPRRRAMPA